MPRVERSAEVVWQGNLARGEGQLSAASSHAFSALPFRLATRVGSPEGETSPEELLAAAHGGCFANALAGELTQAGSPPDRIELSCRITLDEVEAGGHEIVASQVTLAATVPGIDEAQFATLVERADAGCPFSTLLRRGQARVTVSARLEPAGG